MTAGNGDSKMILSRNKANGYFCPVCGGRELRHFGQRFYDTGCGTCGAEFYIADMTPDEFAQEVAYGASNLNWDALNISQIAMMASRADREVADALRDPEVAVWIDNYIACMDARGDCLSNQEWAEEYPSIVREVTGDPSGLIYALTEDGAGYEERDLLDRLMAINAGYNRR